jgi:hypothetical protein
MITPEFLLGVLILASLLLGAGIGALIQRSIQRSKPPAKQTSTALAQDVPSNPRVQPGSLKFSRTVSGFSLELDGLPLNDAGSLTPQQRGQLQAILTELNPWLEVNPQEQGRQIAPPEQAATAVPQRQSKTSAPRQVAADTSIVEQIDDLLQVLLPSSPFAGQGIHIASGPTGSVMITHGMKTYEGIDSVPDQQLKDLIRKAVSEWERRQPK